MKQKVDQDQFKNYYSCCSIEHEDQEIIGFCMLYKCQFTPSFCVRCINQDRAKFHIGHQESYCLGFKDIRRNLQEGVIEFKKDVKVLEQINELFKKCQNYTKKLLVQGSANCLKRKLEEIMRKIYQIIEIIGKKIELFKKSEKQLLQQNYKWFKNNNTLIFLKKGFQLFKEKYQYKSITKIKNKQQKSLTQLDISIKRILALLYFSKGLKCVNIYVDKKHFKMLLLYLSRPLQIIPNQGQLRSVEVKTIILLDYVLKQLVQFQIASTLDGKNNRDHQKSLCQQNNSENRLQVLLLGEDFIMIRQSNDEDEIGVLNDIIKSNQSRALAYCIKGYLLEPKNHFESALKCFDEAISLNSKNAYIYNSKWIFLHHFGKYDQSANQFDEAIKLSPNKPTFYINKGISLIKLGRFEDSIINFNQAITLEAIYTSSKVELHLQLIKKQVIEMYYQRGEKTLYKFPLISHKGILLKPGDADDYFKKGDEF